MEHYLIKAGEIWHETGIIHDQFIEVKQGIFQRLVTTPNADLPIINAENEIVAPGLFDTHIHGISGYDVMDGTEEAIHKISESLGSIGVTRFLPTTLTSNDEQLEQAIVSTAKAMESGLKGAKSEGIFLEGPYFTEKYKGAQNPAYFKDPKLEEYEKWMQLSNNKIVKIALAPERENTLTFIQKVTKDGIIVSIAHTDADHLTCKEAIKAGASVFTHLFNGMRGLHHREPGVVGAALSNQSFTELIADGHHVSPDLMNLIYQLKGQQTVLITDCMQAGLMPDGDYMLGEFPVVIKDGIARMETGSLAGSTLVLKDAAANFADWTNASLSEAWHLASLSPAKSMRLDDKIGSIKEGKVADFVIMNKDLEIQQTAVEGKVIFHKE